MTSPRKLAHNVGRKKGDDDDDERDPLSQPLSIRESDPGSYFRFLTSPRTSATDNEHSGEIRPIQKSRNIPFGRREIFCDFRALKLRLIDPTLKFDI